jgi:DNA-binding MarR family transcriptional regulator
MNLYQRAQIDAILYQVLRTIYHYERSIAAQYGMDFEQIYILQFLRRHPYARLTDLAAELQMPKFAASRLIRRLEQSGHISKTQDMVDRRNYHLQLEASGEQVLSAIETASYQRIRANLEGKSAEEVARLVEVAEQMHIVLGVTDQVIKLS